MAAAVAEDGMQESEEEVVDVDEDEFEVEEHLRVTPEAPPVVLQEEGGGEGQGSEKVEPLNPWVYPEVIPEPNPEPVIAEKKKREKKNGKKKKASAKDTPTQELQAIDYGDDFKDEFEEEVSASTHISVRFRERRVVPDDEQRARFRVARRAQLRRLKDFYSVIWKSQEADPRGPAELVLCSVNLNNFGSRAEMNRMFQATGISNYMRIRHSVSSAINKAGCSFVGLQGLVGNRKDVARRGAEELAARVSRDSGEEWTWYVGDTNSNLGYNGFLLRKSAAEAVRTVSHTDKLLPRFGKFRAQKFYRGPLEVVLKVFGQDVEREKLVMVYIDDFQSALFPLGPEPEYARMQHAEALKQILLFEQENIDPQDAPIFVLMLDRAAPVHTPTNYIMQGRLELVDFKEEALCELGRGVEYTCSEFPKRPQTLFGLSSLSPVPKWELVTRRRKGHLFTKAHLYRESFVVRQILQLRNQLNDIYMFEADIPFTYVRPGVEQVKRGAIPVSTRRRSSPLLWVELNW